MALPEPGLTLSHYTLVERIGEGGMGVVYKALDNRLHRHVAIKVLRPDLTADPERQRMFLREARAAAAVSHPGIATVHEVDETGGVTFIVMELVEGRPLGSMIRDQPIPIPEAIHLAIQVAEALSRAHSAGVVHRDLKPDNIIVGPDRRARILDFGLATVIQMPARAESGGTDPLETTVTLPEPARRLMGTVSYMSPEQARGEEVDARSDIFSFGATLYEMLAGRRAFPASTITETLAKILEAEPVPLPLLRPDMPETLARVVERCLRKSAADRFAHGEDLVTALRGAREILRSGAASPPALAVSSTTIAVLPFSVRGSQEYAYLGAGLVDLLSTKLDGAGELRSVDPHVILCCADIQGGGAPDPGVAAATARRFGAGLFLLGSLLEIGGQLHIEASLYDGARQPKILSRASARGPASGIFDMVDQLISELLARWAGGPGYRLTRIGALATDSFPALKAYLEGEAEMRAMRRLTAVESYRRAVDLDPGFALGWYRLGVAALWSGQGQLAYESARQAVQHSNRLSERDRHLVAAFDASVRGANEEAEGRYRAILGRHPDDVEAWYQLGELLFHCGPLRGRPISESREAWERMLSLDPKHLNGMVHLLPIAARAGDAERADSLARRVQELSPTGDAAIWVRAYQAYQSEDTAARAAVAQDLRKAADYIVVFAVNYLGFFGGSHLGAWELAALLTEPVRSPEVRAFGHVLRAYLDLALGRWRASRREVDLAAALSPATAVLHRAHMASLPFVEIEPDDARAVRDELDRWAQTGAPAREHRAAWLAPHEGLCRHLAIYLAGLLDARLGRSAAAAARADRMEALGVPPNTGSLVEDLALGLRARAALAEAGPGPALAILERARMQARFDLTIWSPFYSQCLERFTRADLLDRMSRDEEAISWFSSFEETSVFDQIFVAPAHARRARICERLDRTEQAAAHVAEHARLWQGADPDLVATPPTA